MVFKYFKNDIKNNIFIVRITSRHQTSKTPKALPKRQIVNYCVGENTCTFSEFARYNVRSLFFWLYCVVAILRLV